MSLVTSAATAKGVFEPPAKLESVHSFCFHVRFVFLEHGRLINQTGLGAHTSSPPRPAFLPLGRESVFERARLLRAVTCFTSGFHFGLETAMGLNRRQQR